ncbi:cytochrome P450 [Aspergillus welwitschiae]|uniref:Cytochrome P450 n=1 Tax=Aspergillus welwitschiae TaxID=1341132 RepID=A0A3F3Q9Z7_9EURO|nr:cytochrome P450 [Aspergillus welwitschiae]RDH36020.1 cytochrome P450 [Aspergillus welwitschiae]
MIDWSLFEEARGLLMHPIPAAVIAISTALLYAFFLSLLRAYKQPLASVPGPLLAKFTTLYRPWLVAKGNAPEAYRELHRRYGRIVRTGPETVDISDPAALAVVYGISSGFLKSAYYDVSSPLYEDSPMASMFSVRDPAQHRALRRPVAQKFSMSSVKLMEPLVNECNEIFLRAMRSLEGQPVDLSTWLQWYAFDVIGAISFQRRFGFMEEQRDINGMIGAIDSGLHYASIIGQIPAVHPWLMGSRVVAKVLEMQPFFDIPNPLRTIVEYTQECMEQYNQKSASDHDGRPDFLSWLQAQEVQGKPMSHRDMINHLSNNLLAGSDTTAISLRAIIYYLVKSPRVYRNLQKEIDEADQAGKLSRYVAYGECLELEYLQAVIKEAMRCHPGVSFPLERVVPEGGADLCGVHLAAGTVVGINPAVLHHDTSIFGDDAGEFRPERWIESTEEQVKIMDRHLLTFGYGSRTCIGKNISMMEMGKLVPQLLRHFEIEWASHENEWRVRTFFFAKQHGLVCRLALRNK